MLDRRAAIPHDLQPARRGERAEGRVGSLHGDRASPDLERDYIRLRGVSAISLVTSSPFATFAQKGSSSTRAFAVRIVAISDANAVSRYGFVFTFTTEARPRATKCGAET